MHSQRFLDLSLRINEPYWLLHQGSCEHFIVVDQIRSVLDSLNRRVRVLIYTSLVMVFSLIKPETPLRPHGRISICAAHSAADSRPVPGLRESSSYAGDKWRHSSRAVALQNVRPMLETDG